jgi:hypothetical protein
MPPLRMHAACRWWQEGSYAVSVEIVALTEDCTIRHAELAEAKRNARAENDLGIKAERYTS